MVATYNLYLDDSGVRYPDRRQNRVPAHGADWFALGGILVKDEDEAVLRELHAEFCQRWQVAIPLHSSEIRAQTGGFRWLRSLETAHREQFYEELSSFLEQVPVLGIACVIDRPGYNARYQAAYGKLQWQLCKTAFSIVVERSLKFGLAQDRKLRVFVERCSAREDAQIRGYFDEMRSKGMPFKSGGDEKYGPLSEDMMRSGLYEFDLKFKTSPPMQVADLYLWPICMAGYHRSNRPYLRLQEHGRLIECVLPVADHGTLASKYSCFEGVQARP